MGETKQPDAKERWAQISEANEFPALQIELLRRFLREFPKHVAGRWFLGKNLSDLSRFDEAVQAFHKYLEVSPAKLHFGYCALGELYRHKGEDDAAEQWYQKAIAHDPHDAQSYIYLGAMLARRGRLAEAVEIHRRRTTCKNGCIDEAWHNLGLVLRAMERYEEAAECFDRALKIDRQYKDARLAKRDVRLALRARASTS